MLLPQRLRAGEGDSPVKHANPVVGLRIVGFNLDPALVVFLRLIEFLLVVINLGNAGDAL